MRVRMKPVNPFGPTRYQPSGARQRLDPGRQPRKLPGHRIGVNHTLARRALHLRLGIPQRHGCSGLVAARERSFDLLHERAHARLPRLIARGAGDCLTDALARRCGIGHAFFDHEVSEPSQPRFCKPGLIWRKRGFYAPTPGESRLLAIPRQVHSTGTPPCLAFASGSIGMVIIR
jgi:hypothetical protein